VFSNFCSILTAVSLLFSKISQLLMRIHNTHAHTHDVYTCFIHTNPQTIGAQGFRRIHFHLYSFCVHLKSLICSQFFTSSFSPIVTFSSPKLLYRSHKKRLPKHHLTFWKTLFSSLHSIFSINRFYTLAALV